MNFLELSLLVERIVRRKVVRNGEIKRIKKSNRPGYYIDSDGKEKKRTSADALKLTKTQKRASIKRKAKSSMADTKRDKSLRRRTW